MALISSYGPERETGGTRAPALGARPSSAARRAQMRGAARREFRFERGLCPRTPMGEDSEGAVWAPSDRTLQMVPHRRSAQARSILIVVPERTFLNTRGSPSTLPNTLTGLAGRISSPRLAGVGPKKMQNAEPGGQ